MPKLNKLSSEEVQQLVRQLERRRAQGKRAEVRRQYREYLGGFRVGDWVSVELEDGENRVTVKSRMERAAKELGYRLQFIRTR